MYMLHVAYTLFPTRATTSNDGGNLSLFNEITLLIRSFR